MNRWALWEALEAAVRASFPDRVDALLSSIESRLDPGPWSVPRFQAGIRPESRDRVLADVERALRAADADAAPSQLRELERWMRDAAISAIRARLGLRDVEPGFSTFVIEWASVALEVGHDTPSLRILAGLRSDAPREVEDWLDRTLRELGVARDAVAELRAATLAVARDTVLGNIPPATSAKWMYRLATDLPEGNGDLELWSRLHWDFDMDWSERAIAAFEREVREAAQAMLGAPGA